ncbi:MAG: hypothetical protein PVI97_07855 [Candidatus Thiodiazotropha sp.]|jgi:hypothetical protein
MIGISVKRNLVIIIGACFVSNAVIAENQGIEETNYELSATISDSDVGNTLSIKGGIRLPIAGYAGASISASYSDFNGENSYVDSSDNSVFLGVFFRKYDLGIINVNYGYYRSEVDSPLGNLKDSINSINVSGVYYCKELDIGLRRSRANPDSINTSGASVSYYVNENLKVGASIARMDMDHNTVFLQYQPKYFGNSTALSLSYQDSESNDTLTFSLAYYFDTKVSLKDRARRY